MKYCIFEYTCEYKCIHICMTFFTVLICTFGKYFFLTKWQLNWQRNSFIFQYSFWDRGVWAFGRFDELFALNKWPIMSVPSFFHWRSLQSAHLHTHSSHTHTLVYSGFFIFLTNTVVYYFLVISNSFLKIQGTSIEWMYLQLRIWSQFAPQLPRI